MNILQHIFKDHFEEMIYLLHPRDSVSEGGVGSSGRWLTKNYYVILFKPHFLMKCTADLVILLNLSKLPSIAIINMNDHTEKLRRKYFDNPPDGLTPQDILDMTEDALLDMDYFLNEDEFEDDGFGEEGAISY